MINETIVINTGPLILLDKIEALDVFGKLPVTFVCPSAVRQELDAGIHHSRTAIMPQWLSVKPLKFPLSVFIDLSIDLGEAEVIQLALEAKISWVCLDDLRGRKVAKRQGLGVIGLLGLLAWAKELKIIPELRPYAERLIAEGAPSTPVNPSPSSQKAPQTRSKVQTSLPSKKAGLTTGFLFCISIEMIVYC